MTNVSSLAEYRQSLVRKELVSVSEATVQGAVDRRTYSGSQIGVKTLEQQRNYIECSGVVPVVLMTLARIAQSCGNMPSSVRLGGNPGTLVAKEGSKWRVVADEANIEDHHSQRLVASSVSDVAASVMFALRMPYRPGLLARLEVLGRWSAGRALSSQVADAARSVPLHVLSASIANAKDTLAFVGGDDKADGWLDGCLKGGMSIDSPVAVSGFTGWVIPPPLVHVSMAGEKGMLSSLLRHCASMEVVGELSRTPLLAAASEGKVDAALMLLEAGASVLVVDDYGNTPLHSMLTFLRHNMETKGVLEVVRGMISCGADRHVANGFSATPVNILISMLSESRSCKELSPDAMTTLHDLDCLLRPCSVVSFPSIS